MKQIIARVLSFLPGLLFLSNAYTWVTDPLEASNGLGMQYLEGIGRSTQIGDFSAFFIGVGIFCLLGSIFKNITFLISAVIILFSAAVMRIVAWQIYDADFASIFISVEIVSSIMILASVFLFRKKENTIESSETEDS
tara:strand:+ start:383 stop:796 length:414 start_codon:yes stop_codon:yes gene_type:complete